MGAVLSPLLANIALPVLDEHLVRKWKLLGPSWTRAKARRAGAPIYRLVRYAEFLVMRVFSPSGGEGRGVWAS